MAEWVSAGSLSPTFPLAGFALNRKGMPSYKVPLALLYIRANVIRGPQVPEFPFMVMYKTMKGKRVSDPLPTHQRLSKK